MAFDQSLRCQNAARGLRRLEDVCEVAEQFGFRLQERHFMPANNLSLFFQREAVPRGTSTVLPPAEPK